MANKDTLIREALDAAYDIAFSSVEGVETPSLDDDLKQALERLSEKSKAASGAFTNIITGLAIKAALPELDVRYHQTGIQDPQHFNHRGVSEKLVYPWLSAKEFNGAKSGWQVRTLERPKPYLLDYAENIATIKEPFLAVYDAISVGKADAGEALAYVLKEQIELRRKKQIELVKPNISQIEHICEVMHAHFFYKYSGKGASRLPVLAIHALYDLIMPEMRRFDGKSLLDLNEQSAADSQTGSAGDIEIVDASTSDVVEAIEIKHNIKVDDVIIKDSGKKASKANVGRYYILTTYRNCTPGDDERAAIERLLDKTGCQVIVNGVLPTIKYYLRLLDRPERFLVKYAEALETDGNIAFEHREAWNALFLD